MFKIKFLLENVLSKYQEYIYQVGFRLLTQLYRLVINILIVRISGIELTGAYYSYLAFMTLSVDFVVNGLKLNYLRNGNKGQIGIASLTNVLFLIGVSILLYPIAYLIGYDISILFYFHLFYIFMTAVEFNNVYYRLSAKDNYSILINSIPFLFAILLLLVFKPSTNISLFIAFSIAYLPAFVTNLVIIVRSRVKFSYAKLPSEMLIFVKNSALLFGTTFFVNIYGNIDQIFLKTLISEAEAGNYKIALTMSVFVLPSISMLSFVYLSKLTQYINNKDFESVVKARKQQTKLLLIISCAFIILSLSLNNYLIPWIFNVSSSYVILISKILPISVFFNCLATINSYTLIAFNKEKTVLKIVIFASFFNVIANYILISFYDAIGAAIVNVSTQFIICTALYIVSRDYLRNVGLVNNN